jgi:peptidoglycan/LPS O-acetylase OafA/YrhL
VFTISNSATLQRPFITRVAQYLGNISYALYIIHGPILFTFGSWFMNTYADQEDNRRYAWSFVVATLLNTTLCIWAADLFWRGVDAKSVSFAKWFAEKCWMKD